MRKNLFFFAAAALALASCSNDETVAVNESDAISFRPLVENVTRATDVHFNVSGDQFTVTAFPQGTTVTPYFSNVVFTGDGTTFTSATKYYWPENGSLDFYAHSPSTSGQFTKTDYKTFVVTPSTTAADQIDFVYANTNGKTKENSGTGVTINFRHAESKIAIKVKNTSADLKFDVTGWKVGYLSSSGTFTYAGSNTDTQNNALLDGSYWGSLTTATADTKYENTFSSQTIAASTTTDTQITGSTEMILVPQSQNAATAYASSDANAKVTGSYIAVKMTIKSSANDAIIASEGWAIWPVAFTWVPGKKYTYIVDLAGGGYSETNTDTDADLDPILGGAEIKFVTVTVDDWTNESDIVVPAAPAP